MRNYITELETAFQKHSNIDNALNMKKYMKNNFDFYGIKAPVRRRMEELLGENDYLEWE